MSKLAAMAFSVSFTASDTAPSAASGSAMRFRELSGGLALGITGDTSDDLYYLGQAGAVANSEGVLTPNPVRNLL